MPPTTDWRSTPHHEEDEHGERDRDEPNADVAGRTLDPVDQRHHQRRENADSTPRPAIFSR